MSATSSTLSIEPEVEREYEDAVDTIRTAEPGDYVLFGDRVQPLEVVEASGDRGNREIVLEGPQGGTYTIEEDYEGVGDARVPSFTTEEQGVAVNDLRFSDIEEGDRLPQILSRMRGRSGGDGDSDPDPEGEGGENTDAGTPHDDFTDFDVSVGEGELISSGTHELYGDFTVVFGWRASESAWRSVPNQSTLGNDLDQSDRGVLLADIENATEERGFDVVAVSPDNFDGGDVSPGVASMPEEPNQYDADDYVSILSSDPSLDFESFAEQSEAIAPQDSDGLISRFLGDDKSETWTFIDELLWLGHDVPKSVNNWHLIDYGVITDANVRTSRKAAWYNRQTDELVVLAGVHDEGRDETGWFVYEADDAQNIRGEERSPALETESVEEALDRVDDRLYANSEQVDISIQEDPATGQMTVLDAIASTTIAQRLVAAKDADPFGVRSYVANTSAPEFVLDIDDALTSAYDRAAGAGEAVVDPPLSFARGVLPNSLGPLSTTDFTQLGRDVKALLIQAALGVRENFLGVRVTPVIDYDAFGVTVEYRYQNGRDEGFGDAADLTVDPRMKTQSGPARSGPYVRPPDRRNLRRNNEYLVDSALSKIGLSYHHILHLSRWMEVNDLYFEIPDPWDGNQQSLTVGRHSGGSSSVSASRGSSSSSSSSSSSTIFGRSTSSSSSSTSSSGATVVRTSTLLDDDASQLKKHVNNQDTTRKKLTLTLLAATQNSVDNLDDQTDLPEYADFTQFLGEHAADAYNNTNSSEVTKGRFRDVTDDYEVLYNAIGKVKFNGLSVPKAVDEAIEESGDAALAPLSSFDGYVFTEQNVSDAIGPAAGGSDDDGDDTDDNDPFEGSNVDVDIDFGADSQLSAEEQQEVEELLEDIRSDDIDYGIQNLTTKDRQLIRLANEEEQILRPSERKTLEDTSNSSEMGPMPDPNSETFTEDVMERAREEGLTDNVSRLEAQGREDAAGAMYRAATEGDLSDYVPENQQD